MQIFFCRYDGRFDLSSIILLRFSFDVDHSEAESHNYLLNVLLDLAAMKTLTLTILLNASIAQ